LTALAVQPWAPGLAALAVPARAQASVSMAVWKGIVFIRATEQGLANAMCPALVLVGADLLRALTWGPTSGHTSWLDRGKVPWKREGYGG